MTNQEQLFCDKYLELNDACKAVRAAGYTVSRPGEFGRDLLKQLDIKAYINKIFDERIEPTIISKIKLLKFMSDTVENENIQIKNRLKAAELLCKCYKLFDSPPEKPPQIVISSPLQLPPTEYSKNEVT